MRRRAIAFWLVQLLLRLGYIILFCFCLGLAIAGLGFLVYQARYATRIYQGVRILGVEVGGLSRDAALDLVERELGNDCLPYVSLYAGDQVWTVSPRALGGHLKLGEAVEEAWSLGRTGVFRSDLKARAKLLWWGYRIAPDLHIDPGSALVYLSQIAGEAGHPPRRGQLWVAGLQAHAEESEAGRELDIGATREAIQWRIRERLGSSSWDRTPRIVRHWRGQVPSTTGFSSGPVEVGLVFREVVPPLTEVEGAREQVGVILSSPLMLTFTYQELQPDGKVRTLTRRWRIDRAVLASWIALQRHQTSQGISFKVGVDRDRMEGFLQELADELARPPREARFDYDPQTSTLVTLTPEQWGHSLDIEAAVERLAGACLSSDRQVDLPVHLVPPRVTRADLVSLLPLSLISQGQSSFRESERGRLQDIRLASARFHGFALPPQTTFSFLDNLGLVTVAGGYSESWIAHGDSTGRGAGGGVCQVSTACFRAAFWGGYPILERWPHAYRAPWCEEDGSPVGLDAAVLSPLLDLKFRNDTDTPILVLTEVDEDDGRLYFRFYGAARSRKVETEGPIISNRVQAGEPIFEGDPSLPLGARVQVEWPHDGLDVTLYRLIERDGRLIAKEEFFSRYQPWPARYLVGLPRARPRTTP